MSAISEDAGTRRLHYELEHRIQTLNRDQIGAVTGPISRDDISFVAEMVACLRARYLHRVMTLGASCRGACIDTATALELKQLREAYEEAMKGFEALEHALARGYIELEG